MALWSRVRSVLIQNAVKANALEPGLAGYGSRLFGQTHSWHPLVSERKYGHIHGCQKSLAIQMPKLRKRAIHILSLLKKGGLYLAALKKKGGGIRAHIRTMSYIGSSPPPPPPRECRKGRSKIVHTVALQCLLKVKQDLC